MSRALYQRYRPTTFGQVIGQEHIKQTLQGAVTKERIGHAYLFCGPRGTGKTTSARLFATVVNCTDVKDAEPCNKCEQCDAIINKKTLDIIEIDAASHTGVDNIRELRESIKIPPQQLSKKVYIIDEVHMLSGGAFNALLKTLEEPPRHAIFILATTESHKIPATILSRVQRFDFTTVPADQILERLRMIIKAENINVNDDALKAIIRHTKGHVRDAESVLSQVLVLDKETIDQQDVSALLGLTPEHAIEQLLKHALAKDAAAVMKQLQELVESGSDVEFLHKELIEYARHVLLLCVDSKLEDVTMPLHTDEQKKRLQQIASSTNKKTITTAITSLLKMREHSKYSPIPELPLQLALLEVAHDDTLETQSVVTPQPSNAQTPATTSTETTKNTQAAVNIPVQNTTQPERKTIVIKSNKKLETPTPTTDETKKKEEDYVQNLRPVATAAKTTIQQVHEQWKTIIEELKVINHPLGTCLESSSPVRIDINTLLLATTFPFHKERIDELTNKQLIGQVLDKIFKETLNVKAVLKDSIAVEEKQQIQAPTASPVTNAPTTPEVTKTEQVEPAVPPAPESPEQQTEEAPTPTQEAAMTSTKESKPAKGGDDLAKAALEIFGGEMVE